MIRTIRVDVAFEQYIGQGVMTVGAKSFGAANITVSTKHAFVVRYRDDAEGRAAAVRAAARWATDPRVPFLWRHCAQVADAVTRLPPPQPPSPQP